MPLTKAVLLDNTDIICMSGVSTMSLNDDAGDYDEEQSPGVSRDVWGSQW